MMLSRVLAALGLLAAAACATLPPGPGAPVSQAPPVVTEATCVQTSHGCIAINPAVTQQTIRETICTAGYTASVRPPVSYTLAIKVRLLLEAGIDPSHAGEFELDHVIPLALGGSPTALSNLALQELQEAREKDRLEVRLQHLVCHGEIALVEAQDCIARDWLACSAKWMTHDAS